MINCGPRFNRWNEQKVTVRFSKSGEEDFTLIRTDICKSIRTILVILTLLASCGCASTNVPSLVSSKPSFGLDEDEEAIIHQADESSQELEEKGLLLHDGSSEVYLNKVGNSLVPPAAAQIVDFRFYILRDSIVNAFALPNGRIYITVGLLARLENEAELAQILGHEIAHVVLRHQLRQHRNNTKNASMAQLADVVLLGTSVAYIPYVLSVASYSREYEEEADRMSLQLMSVAGYRLEEVYGVFKAIQEVKAPDAVKGSIYSSHPSNKKRELYMREAIQKGELSTNPSGRIGQAEYEMLRKRVYLEAVRLKLLAKQYELALDLVNQELSKEPSSAVLYYYRGEARRGMGDDPRSAAHEQALLYGKTLNQRLLSEMHSRQDEFYSLAKKEYQRTLQLDKEFVQAYRGLGLIAFRQKDFGSAGKALRLYLNKAEKVPDRRYIESLLREVSEK